MIAVTDAIEDLTSNRPNRPALFIEKALAGIGNYSSSKYDPNVMAACLILFNEKGYKIEG